MTGRRVQTKVKKLFSFARLYRQWHQNLDMKAKDFDEKTIFLEFHLPCLSQHISIEVTKEAKTCVNTCLIDCRQ